MDLTIQHVSGRLGYQLLMAGLAVFGSLLAVQAVLVDDTTTLNESAPASGAPWDNVGYINGASGVYLQNGWVITAQHVVGAAVSVSINFGGSSFTSIGAITTLTNPDSTLSDVVLFNIGTTPAAASNLGITSTLLSQTTSVTMIGYGNHRTGSLTAISTTSGPVDGYNWDGTTGTKAWGNNTISSSSDSYVQALPANKFVAFATTFTANGTSGSAQATVGDSGGGVFVLSSSVWQLAGTMNAIDTYTGQTGSTSANGNNTYIADMAVYSSQINSIIATVPEPTAMAFLLLTFALFAPMAWKKLRGAPVRNASDI